MNGATSAPHSGRVTSPQVPSPIPLESRPELESRAERAIVAPRCRARKKIPTRQVHGECQAGRANAVPQRGRTTADRFSYPAMFSEASPSGPGGVFFLTDL